MVSGYNRVDKDIGTDLDLLAPLIAVRRTKTAAVPPTHLSNTPSRSRPFFSRSAHDLVESARPRGGANLSIPTLPLHLAQSLVDHCRYHDCDWPTTGVTYRRVPNREIECESFHNPSNETLLPAVRFTVDGDHDVIVVQPQPSNDGLLPRPKLIVPLKRCLFRPVIYRGRNYHASEYCYWDPHTDRRYSETTKVEIFRYKLPQLNIAPDSISRTTSRLGVQPVGQKQRQAAISGPANERSDTVLSLKPIGMAARFPATMLTALHEYRSGQGKWPECVKKIHSTNEKFDRGAIYLSPSFDKTFESTRYTDDRYTVVLLQEESSGQRQFLLGARIGPHRPKNPMPSGLSPSGSLYSMWDVESMASARGGAAQVRVVKYVRVGSASQNRRRADRLEDSTSELTGRPTKRPRQQDLVSPLDHNKPGLLEVSNKSPQGRPRNQLGLLATAPAVAIKDGATSLSSVVSIYPQQVWRRSEDEETLSSQSGEGEESSTVNPRSVSCQQLSETDHRHSYQTLGSSGEGNGIIYTSIEQSLLNTISSNTFGSTAISSEGQTRSSTQSLILSIDATRSLSRNEDVPRKAREKRQPQTPTEHCFVFSTTDNTTTATTVPLSVCSTVERLFRYAKYARIVDADAIGLLLRRPGHEDIGLIKGDNDMYEKAIARALQDEEMEILVCADEEDI